MTLNSSISNLNGLNCVSRLKTVTCGRFSLNMVQWKIKRLWRVAQESQWGELIGTIHSWSFCPWQNVLPLDRYGFVTFEHQEDVQKILQDVSCVVYFSLHPVTIMCFSWCYQWFLDNPYKRAKTSVLKTRNSPLIRRSANIYLGVSNTSAFVSGLLLIWPIISDISGFVLVK